MTVQLSAESLGSFSGAIARPDYDRSTLTPGIVHIGVGNFHRAHQAVYLDQLFSTGEGHDWALVGASLRDNDKAMRSDLQQQDWLTNVVELDPNGPTARICGSMIDYAEIDPQSVIDTISDPAIRIVSLTITEGGYYIDAATDGFDANHPDIVHDAGNLDAPITVFGCIIAALKQRHDAGIAPFTVMSCDNLPENGQVAREAVVGLARIQSVETGNWIADNVAFPNSMVDCITPATSQREIDLVASRFAINDARPVACEPFRQWVMEDTFSNGRPALEKVGVEFVEDVAPHELMKLRILNGGHAAIAYPAGLLGIHYVHEAMQHPLIGAFLTKLERDEIIPTLSPIPGVSYEEYLERTIGRFSNAAIGDTIPRLCLDGSNRQPKFILPTIADRLGRRQSIEGLALEVALWCRYCAGVTDDGTTIEVVDVHAERLQERALAAKSDPSVFVSMRDVFGSLGENGAFTKSFANALNALWANGTLATLTSYQQQTLSIREQS